MNRYNFLTYFACGVLVATLVWGIRIDYTPTEHYVVTRAGWQP